MSLVCTYLASPKWRIELFQSVKLKRQIHEAEASRARAAYELRVLKMNAMIVAATKTITVTSTSTTPVKMSAFMEVSDFDDFEEPLIA